MSSLDAVVKSTPKENLKITAAMGSELLYQKGIHPYEYIESWKKFEETSLPARSEFYSNLTEEHITEQEYEHAQKVWKEIKCQTLGDYHDLFVETDAALLADVFENFRKLDRLSQQVWARPSALLHNARVIVGRTSEKDRSRAGATNGLRKASIHRKGDERRNMDGEHKEIRKGQQPVGEGYDPRKPKKHIMYYDANNLYGWAMIKPLPIRDFKWKRVMPTEDQIIKKNEDAKCGWILEVDLEYPSELHEENSAYPLAPEKVAVEKEWL